MCKEELVNNYCILIKKVYRILQVFPATWVKEPRMTHPKQILSPWLTQVLAICITLIRRLDNIDRISLLQDRPAVLLKHISSINSSQLSVPTYKLIIISDYFFYLYILWGEKNEASHTNRLFYFAISEEYHVTYGILLVKNRNNHDFLVKKYKDLLIWWRRLDLIIGNPEIRCRGQFVQIVTKSSAWNDSLRWRAKKRTHWKDDTAARKVTGGRKGCRHGRANSEGSWLQPGQVCRAR